MSILKKINDQQDLLHAILEDAPDANLKAKLDQRLRIDDKVLEKAGPITIVQSQVLNVQVVNNISKALRINREIEHVVRNTTEIELETLLRSFLKQGLTWNQVKNTIRQIYISVALESAGSKSAAARRIGVTPRLINYAMKSQRSDT